MTSSDATGPAGLEALKEAMELLDGLEFDAIRGGNARSEKLFLSIVPDWEDDARGKFRATLVCQAMGHRNVDWQLMRVSVRPQSTTGFFVQHVLPLSPAGQAMFEGLEPGTYVLRAYCRLVQFRTSQPGKAARSRLDETEIAQGVAMDEETSARPTTDSVTQSAADTDAIVVLIGSRDKFITLEFVTNDEELGGRSLEFCVANPETKQIYLDEQLATFESAPSNGEYRFRTSPIELSFSAGDEVEVSYRIIR